MSDHKIETGALIVFGSGPGVGVHVAKVFAQRGFRHVVLLSRDTARLVGEVSIIKAIASDVKIEALGLDLSKTRTEIEAVLVKVGDILHDWDVSLEVVLYNAARVAPSKIGKYSAEALEIDLRITTVSLYTVLLWSLPRLTALATAGEQYKPTILVTSGGLYSRPSPSIFSLSCAKAAQFNLMTSIHETYGPQGVHACLVPVSGMIRDDSKVTTPMAVAETMWDLYREGRDGRLSVEMHDPQYEDALAYMKNLVDQM